MARPFYLPTPVFPGSCNVPHCTHQWNPLVLSKDGTDKIDRNGVQYHLGWNHGNQKACDSKWHVQDRSSSVQTSSSSPEHEMDRLVGPAHTVRFPFYSTHLELRTLPQPEQGNTRHQRPNPPGEMQIYIYICIYIYIGMSRENRSSFNLFRALDWNTWVFSITSGRNRQVPSIGFKETGKTRVYISEEFSSV